MQAITREAKEEIETAHTLTPRDRVAGYLQATTEYFDTREALSEAEAVKEKMKSGNFTAYAVGTIEFTRQLELVKSLRLEKEEKRRLRRTSWRMLTEDPGDRTYWDASARASYAAINKLRNEERPAVRRKLSRAQVQYEDRVVEECERQLQILTEQEAELERKGRLIGIGKEILNALDKGERDAENIFPIDARRARRVS